jgi:hypothetical protein
MTCLYIRHDIAMDESATTATIPRTTNDEEIHHSEASRSTARESQYCYTVLKQFPANLVATAKDLCPYILE